MDDLPLIDLSHHDLNYIRLEVEKACRDIGFMYVIGHGIDKSIVQGIRKEVINYFSRPLEEKLLDRISSDNYRGYIPLGFFNPNVGGGAKDLYEGYKLHYEVSSNHPICNRCDLYGPNKWPSGETNFKEAILDYWLACDSLAKNLLSILASILSVDRSRFLGFFETPLTNMTLLRYPIASKDLSSYGIHPHKDTDALTILASDDIDGLMVKSRGEDNWIDVMPPRDSFIVNIGDMLELWSGGYFVSTPHKVLNKTGKDRYSFPYFSVPRYDTIIEPLLEPQSGFKRKKLNVGQISREVWRTNWPNTSPKIIGADLGTLQD